MAESATKSVSEEISRVSLKLPPIWRDNVEVWFWAIESQFVLANVTREVTKYHYVVSAVDGEILVHVTDLLRQAPVEDQKPYSQLKARLIAKFESSDTNKLRKLLSDLELGDKQPSHLLQEMRNLAAGKIDDDVLKMIWLQRLPFSMQQILSASSEDLNGMACTADKIAEVSSSLNVNSVQANNAFGTAGSDYLELKRQISELADEVKKLSYRDNLSYRDDLSCHDELSYRGRTRYRGTSPNQRRFSRDRPGRRGTSRDYQPQMCWYHRRFESKALKCIPPCHYSEN